MLATASPTRLKGTVSSKQASVIHRDSEILGGIPIFAGTRVPVKTLMDYLEAGGSLDEFLDHFPSMSRSQAVAALVFNKDELATYVNNV